jgi:hypothetical protein
MHLQSAPRCKTPGWRVREFCVNQSRTVMHSTANWRIWYLSKLLINRLLYSVLTGF